MIDGADMADTPEDDNATLKYGIVLMIKHPDMDPARITSALGIAPRRVWKAGDPRQTPIGTKLPGQWPGSYWMIAEEEVGYRDFFTSVENWVDKLEPFATFLSEIIGTGGSISIALQLSGKQNIGDIIGWEYLARLAALKITLGVEVFPHAR